MLDRYNRDINYLRISVTDRCNLKCVYCFPKDECIKYIKNDDLISFEKITDIVKEAVKLGITKIRLTGGEPLLRENIEDLVYKLSHIKGIEHIGLTTNGFLLSDKIAVLKKNGLNSVNISLDTLNREKYKLIKGKDYINKVLSAIDKALELDMSVKINMVICSDTSEKDILSMKEFCIRKGIKLQMINHYSLNCKKNNDYIFDRPPKCANCNRIRLLSDGRLKPCLFSNKEISIDDTDISEAIKRTVESKPKNASKCDNRKIFQIGG